MTSLISVFTFCLDKCSTFIHFHLHGQNTKSLVRCQAHDIILAQQIHFACPSPWYFMISLALICQLSPQGPDQTPKKEQPQSGWSMCTPTKCCCNGSGTHSTNCCPENEILVSSRGSSCSNRICVPAPLELGFLHPHEPEGMCSHCFVADGHLPQWSPRGFASDLLNPEKKPGFCKAGVELLQGTSERKLLSSIKSLGDSSTL